MQMNDKFGGHRPRPARLGPMGALLAMFGIVALAACSSSSTTAGGGGGSTPSTAYQKALAYARCIRAHGIPNYPDPNSKGQFVIPNGGSNPTGNVSTAVLNAANKACQKLAAAMPGPQQGGQAPNASSELRFVQCLRSHGEPSMPDPKSDGEITLPPGVNSQSPQFQAAEKACQSLMPNNPGGSAP
jgi:hypothetical protein